MHLLLASQEFINVLLAASRLQFHRKELLDLAPPLATSKKYFSQNLNNNPDPENDITWREWKKRSPLLNETCLECECLANCGGGCPYLAYKEKGSIYEIDERICNISKKILEWMIWDLYDKMQEDSKTQ
ncbi:MAG: SPASM domain-containing protein [archaeon]